MRNVGRTSTGLALLLLGLFLFNAALLDVRTTEAQTGGGTTGGTTAETTGNQNDQDCPIPEEVNTTTGSGDEQSPVFDITGESFRVTIDVDPTSQDPSLAGVTVFVRTENDEPVTRIAKEGGGTETSIVNAGEDRFFLDILAANANYEIIVEDCTGDDEEDNGGTDEDEDTDDDGIVDGTIPKKPLPKTGGSPALFAGGAALLVLYGALVAWRLKTRER